jgi:hypothetical protein
MLSLVMLLAFAGTAHGQAKAKKPAKERNRITQEEIAKSTAQNALQAVRSLRGFWLSSRGATSLRPDPTGDPAFVPVTKDQALVVYVDGVRRGGLPDLEMISIDQVKELRFLPSDEATTRFGAGHPLGAIEVSSRK